LEFSNVKYLGHNQKNYLIFTLNNDHTYAVLFKKEKEQGIWIPEKIRHSPYKKHYDSLCTLCNKPTLDRKYIIVETTCEVLERQKAEIFEKLMNIPSLRLRMMFV